MIDSHGIEILPTDTLMVTAWGGNVRNHHVRTKSPVVRFNRVRVVIVVNGDEEMAVHPGYLSVLRRDGVVGFEHNRPQDDEVQHTDECADSIRYSGCCEHHCPTGEHAVRPV